MFHKVIFFAIISIAYAAVFIDGPCPAVKAVDYLNITEFVGTTWYEVAKYPNDFEKSGDCATISFQNSNGNILFVITEVIDGQLNKIEGKMTYARNSGTTGFVNLKSHGFEASEATDDLPVYFVAYDNNYYYIAYDCKYNEKTNKSQVFAWIKSRSKMLQGDAKTAVDKFLQTATYLDRKLFFWDTFKEDNCKLKA